MIDHTCACLVLEIYTEICLSCRERVEMNVVLGLVERACVPLLCNASSKSCECSSPLGDFFCTFYFLLYQVLMREHRNWKTEVENLTGGTAGAGHLSRRTKSTSGFLQTFPDTLETGGPRSAPGATDLRVSMVESGAVQASDEPLVAPSKTTMALESEQRRRTQQRSEFWPLLVAVIAVLAVALTVSLSCSLGEGEAFHARRT